MEEVVIVTGASRGIGAATAKLLGSNDYKVYVNYLSDKNAADRVCASIAGNGGVAFAHKADVSDEAQVLNMFETVNGRWGEITHLVNNVGVLFTKTELINVSAERFTKVLNTNVLSAFLCSKAFVKQNVAGGAIVNVSSIASRTGAPFEYVDYATSKGAPVGEAMDET